MHPLDISDHLTAYGDRISNIGMIRPGSVVALIDSRLDDFYAFRVTEDREGDATPALYSVQEYAKGNFPEGMVYRPSLRLLPKLEWVRRNFIFTVDSHQLTKGVVEITEKAFLESLEIAQRLSLV